MPDISTANQDRINAMCPLGFEFLMGSRIAYLTTAGALSSATITAPAITSGTMSTGTINDVYLVRPVLQKWSFGALAGSASGSTVTSITKLTSGGQYYLNATAGATLRISTLTATGVWMQITNIATAATGQISLCTDNLTYAGAATAYSCLTIAAGQTADIRKYAAGRWFIFGGTGTLKNLTSDATSSG